MAQRLCDEVPEHLLADVLAGRHVVADIGQVEGEWKRLLEQAVRAGQLVKWKGKWFPTAGAPWGMGPLKTCYGTAEARDYYRSFRVTAEAA